VAVKTGCKEVLFRGRYTARTSHRCPGYNRIEITLTPDITRSAIVFHSSPTPYEICPVCREVVKDAEIFNCVCNQNGRVGLDATLLHDLTEVDQILQIMSRCPPSNVRGALSGTIGPVFIFTIITLKVLYASTAK